MVCSSNTELCPDKTATVIPLNDANKPSSRMRNMRGSVMILVGAFVI